MKFIYLLSVTIVTLNAQVVEMTTKACMLGMVTSAHAAAHYFGKGMWAYGEYLGAVGGIGDLLNAYELPRDHQQQFMTQKRAIRDAFSPILLNATDSRSSTVQTVAALRQEIAGITGRLERIKTLSPQQKKLIDVLLERYWSRTPFMSEEQLLKNTYVCMHGLPQAEIERIDAAWAVCAQSIQRAGISLMVCGGLLMTKAVYMANHDEAESAFPHFSIAYYLNGRLW